MISTLKKIFFFAFAATFVLCGLFACASMGTPQGGAYDVAPPQMVGSTPGLNTLNFNGNRIEIIFDELIQLEKQNEKVIITPPQKQVPIIQAMGKKVRVELQDSLWPNTTYTIDFTDAIVDNNEKNPLENFSFAFSTGESLDSLVVSGILLNAENLEPMPNILVGLHKNLDDTAFTNDFFIRTTKTNDRGQFWVRNVSYGDYHVFALNDMDRNYMFNQPGEDIAFLDSTFSPNFEPAMRYDTVWADSITVDTIIPVHYNRFTPDDIVLRLSKESFERQYLMKSERITKNKISFYFNDPFSAKPEISLLGMEPGKEWFIPEISADGTTYHYWITDSLIYSADTLHVNLMSYQNDTLNNLVRASDTLSLFMRKQTPKKPKKGEENKIEFMDIAISAQPTIEVYDTLRITFPEPLKHFDASSILVEQKVDTLWNPETFTFIQDSLNPRIYYTNHKWKYGLEYRITLDSAVFYSISNKWNNKQQLQFKIRNEDEYGHLYVIISGVEGSGFGELLDGSDKPVRKSVLKNGEILFFDVKPGKYFLRYIEDSNSNKKWDPGHYASKTQPENVFYFPGSFNVRQNWEEEKSWNVTELPVYEQKPLEIIKNKPAEKRKTRTNEYDNNQQNNETQQNRNNRFPSL